MPQFIFNKRQQSNGDHEVHNTTKGCVFMPSNDNQVFLGTHASCKEAITYAKALYPSFRINGCYFCCNECHTS